MVGLLAPIVAITVFVAFVAARPVVPVRLPLRAGTTKTSRLLAAARAPRQAKHHAEALVDDVPDVVDLLAVAATAGCNVRLAVEAAARRNAGPAAAFLTGVLGRVATGERLGDAMSDLLDTKPRPVVEALRPLVSVLADSDRYGTPLGPALERLAGDLRIHRQHRAEAKARRVPVRLLLPLVLCVLPSFALLTVAPLLAGVARGALADTPSIPLEHPKENP